MSPMANQEQRQTNTHFPQFIEKRLENPPVIAGENPVEFRVLFHELESACLEHGGTAAEHTMVYQVAVLTWRLMRLERMRALIIRHHRPVAVLSLVRRTDEHPEAERGSLAHARTGLEAMAYFASKDAKKKLETRFAEAGYAEDAVEIEAFLQSQNSQVQIERETAAAQRQLLAYLKELERRSMRRAKELLEAALKAVKSAANKAS
jgi:hypothetical protein